MALIAVHSIHLFNLKIGSEKSQSNNLFFFKSLHEVRLHLMELKSGMARSIVGSGEKIWIDLEFRRLKTTHLSALSVSLPLPVGLLGLTYL